MKALCPVRAVHYCQSCRNEQGGTGEKFIFWKLKKWKSFAKLPGFLDETAILKRSALLLLANAYSLIQQILN